MGTEEQSNAFNEVRAILGKLDRSIDEARTRRLEPDHPVQCDPNRPHPRPDAEPTPSNQGIGRSSAQKTAKTELQKKSATFGRAKPLNRDARPANAVWKTTSGDEELIG